FYQTRAALTEALIRDKGFNIVAVEADWPDAYRANRWVRHESSDPDAETALSDFQRFPRWMWRNRDVIEFLQWLRAFNAERRAADYANRDGRVAADEYFFAEQNALLVRNAEEYYRSMFAGHVLSWNLRDTHMMETLEMLLRQARQTTGAARAVVWAHNSHLG